MVFSQASLAWTKLPAPLDLVASLPPIVIYLLKNETASVRLGTLASSVLAAARDTTLVPGPRMALNACGIAAWDVGLVCGDGEFRRFALSEFLFC